MSVNIFTRRLMGMDYRVWLAMLITCCSTVALFGYKHISGAKDIACPSVIITVDGKSVEGKALCYLNRLTMFKVQAEGITKVEWDFKDGTDEVKGQIAPHEFLKEGRYKIKVVVDNHCPYEQEIIVKKPPRPGDGEKTIIAIFPEPAHPKVGSSVAFHAVPNVPVKSYQWKLLGTDEIQQGDVASFIFDKARKYTVQLIINNDPSTVTTEVIEVFALTAEVPDIINNNGSGTGFAGPVDPPPVLIDQGPLHSGGTPKEPKDKTNASDTGTSKPPPVKPGAIKIDPDTFKGLLQEVINENKEIQELYEYLDYRESTMVQVNGKTPLIPLKDFCKKMRDKKKNKRKVESLSFQIDDKKSIQALQVKVRESGRFLNGLPFFN